MILLCAACILPEQVLSVSATPGRRSILSDEGAEVSSNEIMTGISTPEYRIRIVYKINHQKQAGAQLCQAQYKLRLPKSAIASFPT